MALSVAESIEKLSKISPRAKFGVVAAISAVFWLLFLSMLYWDLAEQAESLDQQLVQLREEKSGYEDKKQQYMAFRSEVVRLKDEQNELVKVLPSKAEIPSFLQSIHAQAELAGLNILSFDQQGERKKGFYAMIPVRMTIEGSFHQVMKFFHSVGKLKRIVNIGELRLGKPRVAPGTITLTANFVASTFRFLAPKPA